MIWAVTFAVGGIIGLLVGRWWALLAALGVFLWIGTSAEVEISPWLLALMYAVFVAAGIAAGVLVRAVCRRSKTVA